MKDVKVDVDKKPTNVVIDVPVQLSAFQRAYQNLINFIYIYIIIIYFVIKRVFDKNIERKH